MLYALIILLTMGLDFGLSISLALVKNTFSLDFAILCPLLSLMFELVLIGLLDIILHLLPKRLFHYEKRFFVTSKKEIALYNKIGVKKWKSLVPELGASGGFSKRNLQSVDEKYLERFIWETCFGEVLHLCSAILGFFVIFCFDLRYFYISLPIAVINFVLNLLPCFIQRYNRHKLVVVLQFAKRRNQSGQAFHN